MPYREREREKERGREGGREGGRGGERGHVLRIHEWVEGVEEVEESQHQKQIEGVVVKDRKCRSLSVCHFIFLPRNTTPEKLQ